MTEAGESDVSGTLSRPDSQEGGGRQDIQNQKELDSLTSEASLGEAHS